MSRLYGVGARARAEPAEARQPHQASMLEFLVVHPLILASSSPRRRELLALGWSFDTRAAYLDETPLPGEPPEIYSRRMSEGKALAVDSLPRGALVIGADTIVVLDGRILGKPADAADARAMLKALRGREHLVLTSLTLRDTATGAVEHELARSRVPMRGYIDAEIDAYVASGDPLDKAGAYGIQHPTFHPVAEEAFCDCFANVMGLPLCHVLRRLRPRGMEPAADLPAQCQRFIPYACPVSGAILRGLPG